MIAVGISGSGGGDGVVGSIGGGLVLGGSDLGVYGQLGLGVGTPGLGGVVNIDCLDEVPQKPGTSSPGSPLGEYPAQVQLGDASPGVVGLGPSRSYNNDGSTSLSGGHASLGYQTPGGSVQRTSTGVWCLSCGTAPDHPSPWQGLAPISDLDGLPESVGGDREPGEDGPATNLLRWRGLSAGSDRTAKRLRTSGPVVPRRSSPLHGRQGVLRLHGSRRVHRAPLRQWRLRRPAAPGPIAGSRTASISEGVAMNVNGDRLTFQHVGAELVVRVNGERLHGTETVALEKGGSLHARRWELPRLVARPHVGPRNGPRTVGSMSRWP